MVLKVRRSRRCSFCGKSEKDVSTLLAGARGHICGACVAACSRILQATPDDFAGWDSLTDDRLLESLKPAAQTVDACRAVLQTQVEELRTRGISWATIGGALGISRQAAWERFS